MRIHNSIRNNFLGIIFLFVLVLPNVVFAKYDVKGDTSGNINNYSGGSTYSQPDGGYNQATDGDPSKPSLSLFNKNPQKTELTPSELMGLKLKLEKGGSTVKTDDLTVDNVYTINTGSETIFVYDPKVEPGNPKNANDQVMLGLATEDSQKDARMYVYKNPPRKESTEGDDSLRHIDEDRGLTPGTTVDRKNAYYNAQQEKISADAGQVEANKNYDAAQTAYNQNPNDATANALNEARKIRDDANYRVGQANQNLSGIEAYRAALGQEENDGKCNEIWKVLGNNCILWTVAKITNLGFRLVSFFAYLAGTLFDYSLELSINSAEFFKKLGVIEITWSFIRDILNMTFIFILLWTAIQILIGNEARYNAKKMLTNVIIVAILINFSLFAAKLMVDGSNIISLKIYEAMKANSINHNASISERVMNTVGLTTLYNITEIFSSDTVQAKGYCATNPAGLITISVMGSIFLIVLCLALGLAAILFLIRLVNIIFLFIKSPLWVWGYVMPGNSSVSKFKDEWWNEMKHVLLFPIAYLFWMLVAVIIFEKLGGVKSVGADGTTNNGVSLLSLICQPPTTVGGGIGQTISLVAIFCIVIIFMMKAIEYGVKNASGGSNAIGNDIAKNWSGKFDKAQTYMTKQLGKKAAFQAAAAPGRVGGATLGYLKAKSQGDKGWEGFKDGFANPNIKTKETLRDIARHQVARGGIVGELTGATSVAAALAKRYEDPKNAHGETKEKADERRTKGTITDQNNRNDAIDKYFKISTQKDWLKKNPTGTNADYRKYVEEKMQGRSDAMLGKGVISRVDRRNAAGKTHFEIMKENAIKEVTDAKTGKVSIKFSESAMHDSIKSALEYHTTGDGAGLGGKNPLKGKKRFERYAATRVKARIKAIDKGTDGFKSSAFKKDAAKDQIKLIEKTIQEIEDLPDEGKVNSLITSGKVHTGMSEKVTQVRALNKAIVEKNILTAFGATPTAAEISKADKNIDEAKDKYLDHLSKQPTKLVDQRNKLAQKLKAQEEADKK